MSACFFLVFFRCVVLWYRMDGRLDGWSSVDQRGLLLICVVLGVD